MPDLTTTEVQALLVGIDLSPQGAEDLEEITHRINALHEALLALQPPDLDSLEPATTFDQDAAQS